MKNEINKGNMKATSVNPKESITHPWEEVVSNVIDAEFALRSHIYGFLSWMTDVEDISEEHLTTLSNLAKEFGIVLVINAIGLAFQGVSEDHAENDLTNMEEYEAYREACMIGFICGLAEGHRESQGVDECRVGWITKGAESVIDGLEKNAA